MHNHPRICAKDLSGGQRGVLRPMLLTKLSGNLTSMHHKSTFCGRGWIASVALAIGPCRTAHAQTMEPLSYTNSPIGLNFLIAGYSYQSGSVLADPSLPISNVKASVDSAVLAYSHILNCWGQSGSLALVVPYAWLSASGDVFQQSRSVDRTGLGDLAVRLSVNLYGAPAVSLKEFQSYHQDTIVRVSLVMTAPSGQYIQS